MGRGRAKAKQVKVARQLKYNSGGTDLDRLREELGVNHDSNRHDDDVVDDELADRYADYAGDVDDDDEDEGSRRR
ncbi:hypothetical protein Sme01_44680 [Sphaerisporangium melleum]|uniref:DUF3073 domain-containing protein n=1 Tax=Sphaerisporangium melleum TaxID=321316 RepID=A0A917R0B7_9ACTN|nr:DUF3073 domain-containing protein [Sphaerisporangium melleum]GGK80863.1 hypothetical protein GCM10007964_24430 [Sphaerisporangium melleum]GII71992.1 hypothetical protein Sme01_44680 [Sphaerisporangium melleum]